MRGTCSSGTPSFCLLIRTCSPVLTSTPAEEVKVGDVLVEVFDRDREYLEASFPSRFAATLKPGDTVQIHFPDEQAREGQIEAIPSQAHQSGKGEAEIRVRILPVGKVWPYLPIGCEVQVSLK